MVKLIFANFLNFLNGIKFIIYVCFWTILKWILFLFKPNQSHKITLALFKISDRFPFIIKWLNYLCSPHNNVSLYEVLKEDNALAQWFKPKKVGGVILKSPLIIAPGLVKGHDNPNNKKTKANLSGFRTLRTMGWQIEIGSFTFEVCIGNTGRTMWRYSAKKSLQNRVGLRNPGIKNVLLDFKNIYNHKQQQQAPPFGINIALHPTSEVKPKEQIEQCVQHLQEFKNLAIQPAWITLNLSCPNTNKKVDEELTTTMITDLSKILKKLNYPLWLKIPPNLNIDYYNRICEASQENKIDALVVTNTLPLKVKNTEYTAGMSGVNLFRYSFNAVKIINEWKQKNKATFSIIGCGGIMTIEDTRCMFKNGCDAIELYTALIFKGPYLNKWLTYKIMKT